MLIRTSPFQIHIDSGRGSLREDEKGIHHVTPLGGGIYVKDERGVDGVSDDAWRLYVR
jgi:hypothetical protein